MNRWLFVLFVSIIYVSSCSDDPAGIECDTSARAGITVQVKDLVTGLGIAEGTFAQIREGYNIVDTLEYCGDDSLGNQLTLCGAWERPGTYSLAIEKEAYLPYYLDDIVVLDGVCHVEGVSFTVRMIRDVGIYADVDPDTVRCGELFDIHVTVTNNSSEDFILQYSTTCQIFYRILNSNGKLVFFYPKFCSQMLTTFELAPFATYEKTELFSSASMTPGRYTIETVLWYGYKGEVEVVVVP